MAFPRIQCLDTAFGQSCIQLPGFPQGSGRFAHGGKYIIQLLYDSLEDLNMAISEPIDMAAMSRIDHGHFAGSESIPSLGC